MLPPPLHNELEKSEEAATDRTVRYLSGHVRKEFRCINVSDLSLISVSSEVSDEHKFCNPMLNPCLCLRCFEIVKHCSNSMTVLYVLAIGITVWFCFLTDGSYVQ